jgi:hypothetical protein
MPLKHETGKILINNNDEVIVGLNNTYNQTPVIKITSDSNVNVFIKDITNNSFKIFKSDSGQIEVHYVVIER